MENQRSIVILMPLILWLLSQAFFLRPSFFYAALSLGLLIIVFGVKHLFKNSANQHWLFFIITPSLFFLSLALFVATLTSHFWIQIIFLVNAWFMFSYLRNVYYYAAYEAPERENQLDSLLLSGGFLIIFCSASTLYGLQSFLSLSFILLLLAFSPVAFLVFAQFIIFPKNKILFKGPVILAAVLALLELAYVFSLLPLNYTVLGLMLAVVYYFLLMTLRFWGRGELDRRHIKSPLIISIIIIFFLLLTAIWF